MIRPTGASNPDSPITVAKQRVPQRYQQRHRGKHVKPLFIRQNRQILAQNEIVFFVENA